MSSFPVSQPARAERRQQILGVQDADDILRLVLPDRNARVSASFMSSIENLGRRIVGVDHFHLGAMNHDVGDLQIAQIEHAAEHLRVALGHGAFLGLQIDGAANFLMRRENVGLVVGFAGRQLQHLADDEFDGLREGRQDVDEAAHDRRHEQAPRDRHRRAHRSSAARPRRSRSAG